MPAQTRAANTFREKSQGSDHSYQPAYFAYRPRAFTERGNRWCSGSMPTRQASTEGSGTTLAPFLPGQTEPSPLTLHDTFDGDLLGANGLGSATAAAARQWGVWWVAGLAARAALVSAVWLLRHEHPEGVLKLRLSFDPAHRDLTIIVRDAGSMLPVLHTWDELRADLVGIGAYFDARHLSGSGRELMIAIRVRPPYRVRLTWDVARFSRPHPRYTFDYHETEAGAVHAAEDALRGIGGGAPQSALLTVEYQGPGDDPETWRSPNLGSVPSCPNGSSPAIQSRRA